MEPNELYNHERTALRNELHNLKNCQITFLTSSVTATGILLGLATTLASTPVLGITFLLPLVILLPSWWIFFDKATTITRIVGYYRILESLILEDCKASNFVGWENALGEFRKRQERDELVLPKELLEKPWPSGLDNTLLLRTAHSFLIVCCYIFFALSGLCVVASVILLQGTWAIVALVPAILFAVSIWSNVRRVWQLIHGRHSYNCNEHFWEQILEITYI